MHSANQNVVEQPKEIEEDPAPSDYSASISGAACSKRHTNLCQKFLEQRDERKADARDCDLEMFSHGGGKDRRRISLPSNRLTMLDLPGPDSGHWDATRST